MKTYTAAITGNGLNGGAPIVADIVNSRVPAVGQTLRVIVEPNVAGDTPVVWSSADGKNAFGTVNFSGPRDEESRYQATLSEDVAVYPHDHALGGAIVVADIGPPVNARATFYVRDEAAIGFGCYGFIASGPSVKIVDGFPQRTMLSDADVAVVGPPAPAPTVPGTAAWAKTTIQRRRPIGSSSAMEAACFALTFPYRFEHELPCDAVDEMHPLDVLSADGRTRRSPCTLDVG